MQVLSSHLHQALVQHISVQCSQCRSIKDWQSRFPSQVEWKVMCAHDESHTAASASGIEVTRTSAHRQALSQEMNTKASSVCERCLCATYLARSFLSSLLPLAITNAAVLVHSKVGPLALADGSRAISGRLHVAKSEGTKPHADLPRETLLDDEAFSTHPPQPRNGGCRLHTSDLVSVGIFVSRFHARALT